MKAHKFTRIVSGFVFAITALVWLNAFLNPMPNAYVAAFLWSLFAVLSHFAEKGVHWVTSD